MREQHLLQRLSLVSSSSKVMNCTVSATCLKSDAILVVASIQTRRHTRDLLFVLNKNMMLIAQCKGYGGVRVAPPLVVPCALHASTTKLQCFYAEQTTSVLSLAGMDLASGAGSDGLRLPYQRHASADQPTR